MMINRLQKTDFFSATANDSNRGYESDESLWSRYRTSQDRQLFDRLVRRYEQEIFRHLYRILKNAQLAEDACQGTFLKLHLKRDQFVSGRPFKPWLYAIATHQAIDLQRKNRRHHIQSLDQEQTPDGNGHTALINRIESTTSAPEQKIELEEMQQCVRQSVDNLSPLLREPLDLVYYRGLKIREVAEKLGIPLGTVKSRLRRALLTLNQTFRNVQSPSKAARNHRVPPSSRLDRQNQQSTACCEIDTSGCSLE